VEGTEQNSLLLLTFLIAVPFKQEPEWCLRHLRYCKMKSDNVMLACEQYESLHKLLCIWYNCIILTLLAQLLNWTWLLIIYLLWLLHEMVILCWATIRVLEDGCERWSGKDVRRGGHGLFYCGAPKFSCRTCDSLKDRKSASRRNSHSHV
jgi:hypothetical protein